MRDRASLVMTLMGLKAPEVWGMSLAAADITAWYAVASTNERVALSDPRTMGADSEKSTTMPSPSMTTEATISTSRFSIPSESR